MDCLHHLQLSQRIRPAAPEGRKQVMQGSSLRAVGRRGNEQIPHSMVRSTGQFESIWFIALSPLTIREVLPRLNSEHHSS